MSMTETKTVETCDIRVYLLRKKNVFGYPKLTETSQITSTTADRGGYDLSAYALAILVHIYNSLINMGCLHILPHT
jgi:hypothetical protein